jgi:hypothetical protein
MKIPNRNAGWFVFMIVGSILMSGVVWPAIEFNPRLMITPSQIPEAKRRYEAAAYQSLHDKIIAVSETAIDVNDWQHYAGNAQTAQAAAFRYLLGDSIDTQQGNLGDKAMQILLTIPEPDSVLPLTYNDLIFANGVNQLLEASKAIIGYCTAWDLLKGAGYHAGEAESISADKITGMVNQLYRTLVDIFNVYDVSFFDNNVDLKVASAIGIAALLFDTNENAPDWLLHAYMRYNKIFNVQTASNGGWAEGFDYLEYAAASYIPFVWAHFVIDAESTLNGKSEFGSGIILNNPKFRTLAEWSIRIRMPDGRRPNFDDGRYDGFFTDISAVIENNGLFQWDYQHTLADLDFQNEITEIRLLAKQPDQALVNPVVAGWQLSQFMPDEGVAALRTDWTPNATYLFLLGEHDQMRKAGMGHEHPDATSFIIARGSDVLALDSGYDQFSNNRQFNKASDHNRMAIQDEDLINQTYSILYPPDLDAYIENYISLGNIDYLEISIRESTNPDNTNPKLIGPNTKRHVIFDRSYAYDNDPATEPYFIIVDRVTNDHGAPKNFIWRLHGHQQQLEVSDTPHNVVWNNIGSSQLKAYVGTVSARDTISIEDDTHADAWKTVESHKVLTDRLRLANGETDRFLSILQTGAASATLPAIQDDSVAKNITKKLTIGHDKNVIIVQNQPSFFTLCCPSVEVKEMSIDANIFFAKLGNDQAAPKFVLGQHVTQIVFNDFELFANDGAPGFIILNYDENKISGYYASTSATAAQLRVYTGIAPMSYQNIDPATVNYADGITTFTLALQKEHATSSYSKASFEIEGIDLAQLPVESQSQDTRLRDFHLLPNYPNPFNPATTIRYQLPITANVTLAIYNVDGQHVKTLVNGVQPAGVQSVAWDGRDESGHPASSGLYVYRLCVGDGVLSKKMMLMR